MIELELFSGQAEILVQGEVVHDFPVMCKATSQEEAEKLLTEDIHRKMNVPKQNIKLDLKKFSLLG